jgi:XTP/dITP diphosphohydrolase
MEEVIDNWEAIKAKEKGRTSAVDGVALAQPALPLLSKLLYRAQKYGVEIAIDQFESDQPATEESVGKALAAVVAWAHANDIDPENALRQQARAVTAQIQASETR